MNLTEWQASGKFFEYENLRVFYRLSAESSDEITLCLHGFPSSSFDYHKIWSELADNFSSVLAFDMIGYGFSDKPAGNFDYTTFNQTDVLQALLENLNVKKVHILAHDYGNTITQELLARRTEHRLNFSIESICFLNGALFPETHKPILAQKILISPIGFLFGKFISDSRFKESLKTVFGAKTQPSESEMEDFAGVFKYNEGRRIAHKLIRYMRERQIYRERWVAALHSIDVPFLFINGLADKVSGAHLVERFREVCPQFSKNIVELENIGHYPHFETPETVLREYLKFRK